MQEPMTEKAFYKSKKFWAAALTGGLLVMNDCLDLGLTQDTMNYLVWTAMAYLGGQGLADIGKNVPK